MVYFMKPYSVRVQLFSQCCTCVINDKQKTSLTTGVNNKSHEVNSWRDVIYSLHRASVIRGVSDLNIVDFQSAIMNQVYSVRVTTFICDFSCAMTVHSSQPQPFSFC